MKELTYKKFSWNTHQRNWRLKRPNVCQFELTFSCGLNCNYCYASCYNRPEYIKKELNTQQIKLILDKIYATGVIWLCFTGGDPLERVDFLEIYTYAKQKGFIITIFTNGYSMTEEIADYLGKYPPFVIELTFNGATEDTYEKISGRKGSFKKAKIGIDLILKRKIPLKIKTQLIKDNLEELPKIKEFVENLGLNFRPTPMLHGRLDGELEPCSLRIKPEEVIRLNKDFTLDSEDECLLVSNSQLPKTENRTPNTYLFSCAISGGDGVIIDPHGNLIPCICIREPKINLLKESVDEAQKIILSWVRNKTFTTHSRCKSCSVRNLCCACPGKALLEKGNFEEPIDWFCALAHHLAAPALR